MKDVEKKPDPKAAKSQADAPKQQFSLEELKALGLDPVPYGYPSAD